jgi:hypothetical protein
MRGKTTWDAGQNEQHPRVKHGYRSEKKRIPSAAFLWEDIGGEISWNTEINMLEQKRFISSWVS